MKVSEEAKKHVPTIVEEKRPIVIIDDSPAITLRLKSYLEQLGYDDIKTTNDGNGAIKLVTKLINDSQNPLILLDMQMPNMTGDTVAKKLLEKKPDLSIILITADEKSNPRVRKTIGLGSTAFIQKPFTINRAEKMHLIPRNKTALGKKQERHVQEIDIFYLKAAYSVI